MGKEGSRIQDDDVVMQAESRGGLQDVLQGASDWNELRGAQWSVKKCSFFQLPNGEQSSGIYLYGSRDRITRM